MAEINGAPDFAGRAAKTYRYLRVIAILPAVWILFSVIGTWIVEGHLRTSISAYYGSPVRDVFVGGLMACGICLIAYKGETQVEDYVLNFAGLNVFFVALVPNTFGDLVNDASVEERAELFASLAISLTTFLIVAVIFIGVDRRFFRWEKFDWATQQKTAKRLVIATFLFELVVLGFVVVATLMACASASSTAIYKFVHFGAASTMVVNLIFAASSYAFPGKVRTDAEYETLQVPERVTLLSKCVAIYMLVGLPAAAFAALVLHWKYWIIAIEVWEILGFVAYWILTTREEWTQGETSVARSVRRLLLGPQATAPDV